MTAKSGLAVGPGFFFFGVAAGDYDNDGYPDLYVSGYRRSLLYRNNGKGAFEDVTDKAGVGNRGDWATAAGWFDYDRDGRLDLLVANYVKYDMDHNVVCGDPAPEKRAYCHPDSFPGTSPRLYRNNGDGTFSDVTAAAKLVNPDGKSLAVALADLDGDGWTDVFIANDTQRNFVYFNKGDGTFEDASYSSGAGFSDDGKAEAGMSAGAGDIDGDGDIDLYVSHLDGELNRLYVNEGKRLFTDATITSGLGATTIMNSGFGAQFLDADNDGNRDLVVVNGHILDNIAIYHAGVTHAEVKKLYRNLGGGRFADVTATQPESFRAPRVGRGPGGGRLRQRRVPGPARRQQRPGGAALPQLRRLRRALDRGAAGGRQERARRHGRAAEAHGRPAREPRPGQGRARATAPPRTPASSSAWDRRGRWTHSRSHGRAASARCCATWPPTGTSPSRRARASPRTCSLPSPAAGDAPGAGPGPQKRPGIFMPPVRPPIFSWTASSTLRAASFTAAVTRSWSISTSSLLTTSGSIFRLLTFFWPSITTRTMPPPEVASISSAAISRWTRSCACWSCFMSCLGLPNGFTGPPLRAWSRAPRAPCR